MPERGHDRIVRETIPGWCDHVTALINTAPPVAKRSMTRTRTRKHESLQEGSSAGSIVHLNSAG